MKPDFTYTLPGEIEAHSMAAIEAELGPHSFTPTQLPLVKRVIHTTADFDYKQNLYFSDGAVEAALAALKAGATIVTDTNMALSGVNKAALAKAGCTARCFMAEPAIAEAARQNGTTRAVASVDAACRLPGPLIFAAGNAPTALIRLCEQMEAGAVRPALIIGVPVGFVNVVESKEWLMEVAASHGVPCIVARGRKGGSNVAAALCNALLYTVTDRKL